MENISIQAVSKMVGITPYTLRAWEKRYRVLNPKRSENGRRKYSLSDVEKLRRIIALRKAGHSMSHITSLSLKQLNQLLDNTAYTPDGNKVVFTQNLGSGRQVDRLMQLVQQMDMDQLASQFKMLQLQLDTKSFLLEIVAPTLRKLGEDVSTGKLDVFHEHAVSALLKHMLSGILYATEKSTDFKNLSPIVFATPEDDYHEFGAMIACILALIQGQPVFYLGPNMPADSLAKAALYLKSTLVVLACSAPFEALSREKLRRYGFHLLRQLPTETHLWMGGSRVEDFRQLSKSMRSKDIILKNLEEFDRHLRLQTFSF